MNDQTLNLANIHKQKLIVSVYSFVWVLIFGMLIISFSYFNTLVANDYFLGVFVFFILILFTGPVFFGIQYLIAKANEGFTIRLVDFFIPFRIYYRPRFKNIYQNGKNFLLMLLFFFIGCLILETVFFFLKYPFAHSFGQLYFTYHVDLIELKETKYFYHVLFFLSFTFYLASLYYNATTCDMLLRVNTTYKTAVKINLIVKRKFHKDLLVSFIKNSKFAYFTYFLGYAIGLTISIYCHINFYMSIAICCSLSVLFTYPFIMDVFLASAKFFYAHQKDYRNEFNIYMGKYLLELARKKHFEEDKKD